MVPKTQKIADKDNLVKVIVRIYNMKDADMRNRGFV